MVRKERNLETFRAVSTDGETLGSVFLSRFASRPAGVDDGAGREKLEQQLAAGIHAAARAWPTVHVSGQSFASFLGDLLAREERGDVAVLLSRRHISDLYLVCGCLMGVVGAIQAFDKAFLASIDRWVRMPESPDRTDEVRQVLREKLLLIEGSSRPKLASYSGRGRLANWIAVAAQRTALSLARSDKIHPEPLAIEELEDAVAVLPDAELAYLRSRCEPYLREIFRAVLAGLPERDRLILRFNLVGGLSLEQIGRIYSVNPSTVSRWLSAIRSTIREQVERGLTERLGLRSDESISLAALIASDFDISLATLLA